MKISNFICVKKTLLHCLSFERDRYCIFWQNFRIADSSQKISFFQTKGKYNLQALMKERERTLTFDKYFFKQ